MDTTSDSSVSPTRTAGTIGAITAFLMLIVPMLPGLNRMAQAVTWAVFIGGIYYGMKYFREKTGGQITYSKISKVGALVAFFASVIPAFVLYMTAKLNPAIMDEFIAAANRVLQSTNMSAAEVDLGMKQMNEMMSPVFLAFSVILSYSLLGAIAACILGLFMKNAGQPDKQPYQS